MDIAKYKASADEIKKSADRLTKIMSGEFEPTVEQNKVNVGADHKSMDDMAVPIVGIVIFAIIIAVFVLLNIWRTMP